MVGAPSALEVSTKVLEGHSIRGAVACWLFQARRALPVHLSLGARGEAHKRDLLGPDGRRLTLSRIRVGIQVCDRSLVVARHCM